MTMFFQVIHAILLWLLEFAPYPELFIYPYLTNGGFLPYKQILDQHFPGLMFFPINFFTLGFRDPIAFKLLLILVVLINSALILKVSRSVWAVFFYTIWQPFFEGNQLWLDVFLPLFTLPAYYFYALEQWSAVGLFIGLGVVFKQTLVPLVAFIGITLLLRRKFLGLIKFSFFAILPSLIMLLYFQNRGILQDFWYWAIQFNLTAFASGGKLAPRLPDLIKMSFPIVVIVYAFMKSKKHRLLIGWLVFTILGGIARFGFIHLQPAIPYFAILLGSISMEKRLRLITLGLSAVWIGYFYLHQSNWNQIKYFDAQTLSLKSYLKSGETTFLLGVNPHLYALTNTVPPGKIFVFQFPWFLDVVGRRILDTIKTDPPSVVIYNKDSIIDGQKLSNYGHYLVEYVQENYSLVNTVDPFLIYARRN